MKRLILPIILVIIGFIGYYYVITTPGLHTVLAVISGFISGIGLGLIIFKLLDLVFD